MTTQLQDRPPAAGIDRADLILTAFDGQGRLTLAQVTRRTGVPRSSAHRMLERLVQLRWVRRDGQHYQLGLRLFELGTLAVQQDRLSNVALPYLRELRRLTGHIVHLAVLDGADVVYLDKLDGKFGADVDTRVGGRRPALPTSVGKVLLANATRLSADGLPANPATLPAGPSQIHREFAAIRLHGVAFDRGVAAPDIGCIGAPIGSKGDVVAAISLCGPLGDIAMDSRTADLVKLVGAQIYRKLGRHQVAI